MISLCHFGVGRPSSKNRKILYIEYVISCFALSLLALLSPNSAIAADWISREIKDSKQISAICTRGDLQYDRALEFRLSTATIHLCWSGESTTEGSLIPGPHLITYQLERGGRTTDLIHEGEFMAFGTRFRREGRTLTFESSWPAGPNGAARRPVRSMQLSCDSECTVSSTCEIARRSEDLPLSALFTEVHSYFGKDASREELDTEDPRYFALLNQLFIEALVGNSEAETFLRRLDNEGGACTVCGEVTSSYLEFITRLKSSECHWADSRAITPHQVPQTPQ